MDPRIWSRVRVTFLGDILMATLPSFDPYHSDMYM